jgi:hypothetical protein
MTLTLAVDNTQTQEIDLTRNAVMARIKAALQRRSGKTWSVTGGHGTAYGWITIDAPPKRRTAHAVLKPGKTSGYWPSDYMVIDAGHPGGNMTLADRLELARLLGLPGAVHDQGESVMNSHDAYREYIDRAEGRVPTKIAEPYWD